MQQLKLSEMTTMTISPDERAFFVALGTRIAKLRKAQGTTQIQMANALGVSQQTINSYEVARRRVPVSALPILAHLFGVSIDELLGKQAKHTNGKRGPASKLQRQIEQVRLMPRSKQKFISEMLEVLIKQQQSA